MVQNNLRVKRAMRGLSQNALAKKLTDANASIYCYVEQGKALPTAEDMRALCKALDCAPGDLYRPEDMDLSGAAREGAASDKPKSRGGRQHGDMVEIRSWFRPCEKQELEDTLTALGYRNTSEWLREMYRNTVARARRLDSKKPVH